MLLAINCNNTNIKFGVVDGDRIVGEWRQHTSAMRTADEHAVWLIQLMKMEGIDPKSITDAIIGSVVPQANFNLRRLCTRYLNCEPLFIGERRISAMSRKRVPVVSKAIQPFQMRFHACCIATSPPRRRTSSR